MNRLLSFKNLSFWISILAIHCAGYGNTINVCNTCHYKNIEAALAKYQAFDTIIIHSGIYHLENIIIAKPTTIIGKNTPELHSKSGDELITIIADSVTIEGLTLKNVSTSYLKERSAIRVKKSSHFNLKANTIENCFFGIYLENAKFGSISNNIISGNATTEAESGNGIHAWYCKNISIHGNTINGQRDGIYFEFVNNSTIDHNLSEENTRYGLHFMFSNDNKYLENEFKNNGVGVAVMFSKKIVMTQNHFSFNWGRSAYGLLLKEINDADITHNTFEQNTVGIFVEGSSRINYSFNNFIRNGLAIKFSGGCEHNEFTKNNLTNNSLDLVINTQLSTNQFHHNYWSNYSGYDLDRNGIGDIPQFPVKLFTYILNQCPETIVLMRSLFVDIINFSERISPVFTPKEVFDPYPLMEPVK